MTKKKKLIVSFATVGVLATAAIGGTLAYFTDSATRANVITFGQVSGTLTETGEATRADGTTGKDYTNVKPGDALAKDPTVTLGSNSEDAYVRVKLDFIDSTTNAALDSTLVSDIEKILPITDGWNKANDGYYYYNTKLSNKENGVKTSKVFEKVLIPTEWGNAQAGTSFKINVIAEYIQADNFTPATSTVTNEDGTSKTVISSWGTAVIEKNTTATVAANN